MVDRLEQDFDGKVEFRLYNLERDPSANSIADEYGVRFVPTFVFLDSDGNTVDQWVGGLSEDDLRKKLDALD
ncbi:MAG: hypothetical protein Kow0056_14410 [Coriobacteriia bacterium]